MPFTTITSLDEDAGGGAKPSGPKDRLVIDNGSTDGLPDTTAARYPEAALIRNSANLGFAEGSNQGIRHAVERGGAYVLLLIKMDIEGAEPLAPVGMQCLIERSPLLVLIYERQVLPGALGGG